MRKVNNRILPSFVSKKNSSTRSDTVASSTKESKHEKFLPAEVSVKNSEVEEQSIAKNKSEVEGQSVVQNDICIKRREGRKSFAPEDFVFSMNKQLPLQV